MTIAFHDTWSSKVSFFFDVESLSTFPSRSSKYEKYLEILKTYTHPRELYHCETVTSEKHTEVYDLSELDWVFHLLLCFFFSLMRIPTLLLAWTPQTLHLFQLFHSWSTLLRVFVGFTFSLRPICFKSSTMNNCFISKTNSVQLVL